MGDPPVAHRRVTGVTPGRRRWHWAVAPAKPGQAANPRRGAWRQPLGQPWRATAAEATGHQTSCRFKRPAQFQSGAGDEAVLCLETVWRNHRWHLLFLRTFLHPARN